MRNLARVGVPSVIAIRRARASGGPRPLTAVQCGSLAAFRVAAIQGLLYLGRDRVSVCAKATTPARVSAECGSIRMFIARRRRGEAVLRAIRYCTEVQVHDTGPDPRKCPDPRINRPPEPQGPGSFTLSLTVTKDHKSQDSPKTRGAGGVGGRRVPVAPGLAQVPTRYP